MFKRIFSGNRDIPFVVIELSSSLYLATRIEIFLSISSTYECIFAHTTSSRFPRSFLHVSWEEKKLILLHVSGKSLINWKFESAKTISQLTNFQFLQFFSYIFSIAFFTLIFMRRVFSYIQIRHFFVFLTFISSRFLQEKINIFT